MEYHAAIKNSVSDLYRDRKKCIPKMYCEVKSQLHDSLILFVRKMELVCYP